MHVQASVAKKCGTARNLGAKATGGNPVAKLYETVIEDVIANIKEAFLDDGVDDQVLQELKQSWEAKLHQTRAIDNPTLEETSLTRGGPLYRYSMPASQNTTPGQPVVYQSVQLSNPSQQAAIALQGYQKGTSIIQVPGNSNQFRAYQQQPVILQQTIQVVQPGVTSGNVALARNPAQTVAKATEVSKPGETSKKQIPSATIIQVDGSNDDNEACCSKDLSQSIKFKPNKKPKKKIKICLQLDGAGDSSSDDDDEDSADSDAESGESEAQEEGIEEDPLCSADDDSDQSPDELFDTDNVVVCQYDKIHRSKSKWKFNLKTGIMNLKGKDQAFQKAIGEAEW